MFSYTWLEWYDFHFSIFSAQYFSTYIVYVFIRQTYPVYICTEDYINGVMERREMGSRDFLGEQQDGHY